MARYRLTSPEGETYEITAPDDASQEQVLSYFQSQLQQQADAPDRPRNPFVGPGETQAPAVAGGQPDRAMLDQALADVRSKLGTMPVAPQSDTTFDTVRADLAGLQGQVQQLGREQQASEQQLQRDLTPSPEPLTDVPVLREVGQGLASAGLRQQSLIGRIVGDQETADSLGRMAERATEAGGPSFASQTLTGAVGSVGTMAQAGGNPLTTIGLFTAQAMDEAARRGREAGLSGRELGQYVAGQGVAEGIITSAFQRVGLGGLERRLRGPAATGLRNALRQFGVQSAGELTEETAITLAQNYGDYLAGLSENAVPSAQEFAAVGAQTLLTMGLMEGPRALARDRGRQPDAAPDTLAGEVAAEAGETTPRAAQAAAVEQAEQTAEQVTPVEPREPLVQPTSVNEDGTRATFSGSDPNARQNAEKYAESLAQQFGEGSVAIKPLRRGAGFEVRITEGLHEAKQAVANFADLSQTQRRKTVREARQLGFNVTQQTMTPEAMLAVMKQRQGIDTEVEAEAVTRGTPEQEARATPDTVTTQAERLVEQEDENLEGLPLDQQVKKLKRLLHAERSKARTEPLTGLGNKLEYTETLDRFKRRTDQTGKPFSVLLFDAANLKAANDVFGHEGADALLQQIAGSLRSAAGQKRQQDVVVTRQGGDEFAVILPDTNRKGANRVLQRIEDAVGQQQIIPGLSMFLAGDVATYAKGSDLDAALQRADTGVEARKAIRKKKLGEVTTRSEAEAMIADYKARMADPGMSQDTKARQANRTVQALAEQYAETTGIQKIDHEPVEKVNPVTAKRVARAYEDMPHNPDDPRVQRSYAALNRETLAQFNMLKAEGFVFEPWTAEGQPYDTMADMARDLADNKHLYFFPTESGFGDADADRSDHPMLQEAPGTGGLLYNDVFRAVHDVYGHAKNGYGFDITGEENAWRSHSQMYSDEARGAMTTETRGQSNWVGYGPHGPANRKAIDEDRIGDVTFADQKAGLLPPNLWTASGLKSVDPDLTADPVAAAAKSARKSIQKTPPLEGTQHKRRTPKTLEEFLTPLISRIEDLAPRVAGRLFQMEFDTGVTRERLKSRLNDASKTLVKALGGKKSQAYRDFMVAANNNATDPEAILQAAPPQAREAVQTFLDTFRQLFDSARTAGMTIGDLGEGYWPRYVKDYKALRAEFEDVRGAFDEAFDLARRTKGRPLTTEEKTTIANQVIQGFGPRKPGSMGAPNARKRSIESLTHDQLRKYYVDPIEAAFRYVDTMSYAVERSRFLGRHAQPHELMDTVGALVQAEVDEGRLTQEQQDELRDLLITRFTADMMVTPRWVRNTKQLIYMSTLGGFRNTFTQSMDIAMTVRDYGPAAGLAGAARAAGLSKAERKIAMEEIGIHDHGEEFKDIGKLARATDAVFRVTQFRRFDRFGKESRINAAESRMRGFAANPTGTDYTQFRRRYDAMFGEERVDQMVADLREGKRTEDIRLLVFMEVAKVQPISMSQMPEQYLSSPRGRLLYTLKTFMVTQLDRFRRDVVRNLATPGQRKLGARNLGRFILAHVLIGTPLEMLRDWLMGRAPDPADLPHAMVDAALNGTGISRYLISDVSRDPVQATKDFFMPPMPFIGSGVGDTFEAVTGRSSRYPWLPATPGAKVTRDVPILSDLLYYHSPLGEGWHIGKRQRDRQYREMLTQMRDEAARMYRLGDMQAVRRLLLIYNDRRKQGAGDGRQNPLAVSDLRRDVARQQEKTDE